jgi:NEDD8-activating enzyme E1
MVEGDHLNKKWGYLRKILERSGPFDTEAFAPSPDVLDFLNNTCKILVIGEIYLFLFSCVLSN